MIDRSSAFTFWTFLTFFDGGYDFFPFVVIDHTSTKRIEKDKNNDNG